MTDDKSPSFASAIRPTLDGKDVIVLSLAVFGLTIATFVALNLIYSVMLVAGVGESLVLTGPLLFFIEAVGAMGALYLVLIKARKFSWAELGWALASTGWLILAGAGAVVMYGVLISIALIVGRITGSTGVDIIPAPTNLTPNTVLGFLSTMVLGAAIVPIAEEFLFRGVLYRWLRDSWGLYAGLVGSALVFSAVHLVLGSPAGLQIFLIGLALAYLYEHTGSLKPSMVFHGVNNGISFMWIYLVMWSGAS